MIHAGGITWHKEVEARCAAAFCGGSMCSGRSGNAMTERERASALDIDRTPIERAIEALYAAGLELQVSPDRGDVTPCMTAMLPGCVQRITDVMTDLRAIAEFSPRGSES